MRGCGRVDVTLVGRLVRCGRASAFWQHLSIHAEGMSRLLLRLPDEGGKMTVILQPNTGEGLPSQDGSFKQRISDLLLLDSESDCAKHWQESVLETPNSTISLPSANL